LCVEVFFLGGGDLRHQVLRPLLAYCTAPDDRWGWLWSNWWNDDCQGKPKYSEKTCPSAILSTTNPTWPDPCVNTGRRGGKPAINRLSYGAACRRLILLSSLCWWILPFLSISSPKHGLISCWWATSNSDDVRSCVMSELGQTLPSSSSMGVRTNRSICDGVTILVEQAPVNWIMQNRSTQFSTLPTTNSGQHFALRSQSRKPRVLRNQKFITGFTRARPPELIWARRIHYAPYHPVFKIYFNNILPYFPITSSYQRVILISYLSYLYFMSCKFYFIILNNVRRRVVQLVHSTNQGTSHFLYTIFIHSFINGSTALLSGPGVFFSFVIFFTQSVGLLGRVISPSQGLYLHTAQRQHKHMSSVLVALDAGWISESIYWIFTSRNYR
jgi:hypothetical protein